MASNTTTQHAHVATGAAGGSNWNTSIPSKISQEASLAATPNGKKRRNTWRNPFSELEQGTPPQQKTRLEQLYQFNFEVPEGYIQKMSDEVSELISLGHIYWLPFAERLNGWTKEVRLGTGKEHRDHFYYHGDKRFRTYKDAKRYIYLGYPPSKENADKPLKRWALDQPDPKLVKIYGPRFPPAKDIDSQAAGPSAHSLVGGHSAGMSSYSKK